MPMSHLTFWWCDAAGLQRLRALCGCPVERAEVDANGPADGLAGACPKCIDGRALVDAAMRLVTIHTTDGVDWLAPGVVRGIEMCRRSLRLRMNYSAGSLGDSPSGRHQLYGVRHYLDTSRFVTVAGFFPALPAALRLINARPTGLVGDNRHAIKHVNAITEGLDDQSKRVMEDWERQARRLLMPGAAPSQPAPADPVRLATDPVPGGGVD